jgi:hypothetical protein
MNISREGVNGNLRLSFGDDVANYTVSRLNPVAEASNLMLLAEAVASLQGETLTDLISRSEFRLVPEQ